MTGYLHESLYTWLHAVFPREILMTALFVFPYKLGAVLNNWYFSFDFLTALHKISALKKEREKNKK
jgi:hypothetical protein